MEQDLFNYNRLTKARHKLFYIILMSVFSVACGSLCLYVNIFVYQLFGLMVENEVAEIAQNIVGLGFSPCVMYMVALLCGARFYHIALNALCVAIFVALCFLASPILDTLEFGFGWLLVICGYFLLIVPNVLYLLGKIPARLLVAFVVVVNLFTFGINFAAYGELTSK